MPIQHAIWQVGDKPTLLSVGKLASEQALEEMIVRDPRILSNEWMLIGRQEPTTSGGRIDLLAIAPDGSLILIELKRDKTPRDCVAQALDYAAWVSELTADRVVQIYQRFSKGGSLQADFEKRFGRPLDEEELNQAHQIILVAAELDGSTERIVTYLNERDIAINVLFFQVFEQGGTQLLSRAWLIDPGDTQVNASVASNPGKAGKEPWNGEFYVSYGGDINRNWDEACKYGFISAGGGAWYSRTLKLLSPGDRIWVNIPRTGYVGVGRVLDFVQPAKDFKVATSSGEQPVLNVVAKPDVWRKNADDPELSEYFVRVEWLDKVPVTDAFSEVGLFGNQNSVCRPRTQEWRHTIDRLKTAFPKWDATPGGQ